jgi:hypothetical protein
MISFDKEQKWKWHTKRTLHNFSIARHQFIYSWIIVSLRSLPNQNQMLCSDWISLRRSGTSALCIDHPWCNVHWHWCGCELVTAHMILYPCSLSSATSPSQKSWRKRTCHAWHAHDISQCQPCPAGLIPIHTSKFFNNNLYYLRPKKMSTHDEIVASFSIDMDTKDKTLPLLISWRLK